MPLEAATYINGLNPANPASGDGLSQADDHLRLIKSTIKATFPNLTGAVTVDAAFLNSLVSRIEVLEAGNYIGKVTANAGASIPAKHLPCMGQAVSRTTYAALFTAIGTTWGSGNGTTTFNVPDLRGRVLVGADLDTNRIKGAVPALNALGGYGGSQWLHAHNHTAWQDAHNHAFTTSTGGSHQHTGATYGSNVSTTIGWRSLGEGTGTGRQLLDAFGAPGGSSNFTSDSHNHSFITDGAGDHNHTGTTNNAQPPVYVANNGSGDSQNIQPSAAITYVIFAGV